ncbi:putative transposase [Limimonas halophila]|uniref:Putative transposase n=1 Tax=Limimonas halophila TaxID=1082479 RepID=A0A1G7SSF9_9PROT|nr:Mu transposase C-terminal domain-containing protein [Limimonas halophila]SDG25921.1 putative transposase [Limimonas halophila]
MTSRTFIHLKKGATITAGGRTYRVTHYVKPDAVLAQDVDTGNTEEIHVDAIRPQAPAPEEGDDPRAAPTPDVTEYSEQAWSEAERRFEAIKSLIGTQRRRRADVEQAAAAAGVNAATIYRWLNAYLDAECISALIPDKPGPAKGGRKLTPQVEAIIQSCIRDIYLQRRRGRPKEVANEVRRRCRREGLEPPHANTVRKRIKALDPASSMRKRGQKDRARDQYEPLKGQFPGADYPMAVVQIDHTPADIVVVEEESREPLGRPWITLAIDVYSRMVAACHVSIEAPNAAVAGICAARAMLPKTDYLKALGVPGEWPVWGRIGTLHTDNAKEFRSRAFTRACAQHGIDLQMRPVGKPNYGGHIERLIGTANTQEVQTLPGTTFSSPADREGYDSEGQAALTLAEFERHLVDFIVNIYHKRVHSSLDMPPERKWELGIVGDETRPGTGPPEVPADPARLWVDFLPYEERTVQRYGIVLDNIHYYHEVLNRWINAKDPEDPKRKRRFIVRRNPMDISGVYFYDPEVQRYYLIPYGNTGRPPISVWELREAQRRAKQEGRQQVDEDAIFRAVERMRANVEAAQAKTKAEKRRRHRMRRTKQGTGQPPATSQPSGAGNGTADRQDRAEPAGTAAGGEDIFEKDIQPFDEQDLGDLE